MFFSWPLSLPLPHPIIIAAIHSLFSFTTAAGWKTAFCWGPAIAERGGRRQLKECPSFARLICPSLGGRDILGFGGSLFWQSVSSSWLVCSCLLQGSGFFSSVTSCFLLGCSRSSCSSSALDLLIHFKAAQFWAQGQAPPWVLLFGQPLALLAMFLKCLP